MDGRSVAVLAVVVLLLGGALTIPIDPSFGGAANPALAAATGSINVTAVADYGYQPDTFQQVPTNANITVTFTDDSELPHTFTISSREGFVIPTSYTPTQLDQLLSLYPPLYSAMVNVLGDRSVGAFQSPATPGWYEFVCNVSGHFQNGMYGFIAFGENLPSNLTVPSRVGLGGGSISPIDAAVIGAVLLVLVLSFVVWWRRRSAPRMPPPTVRHPRTASTESREVGVDQKKGAG